MESISAPCGFNIFKFVINKRQTSSIFAKPEINISCIAYALCTFKGLEFKRKKEFGKIQERNREA